MYIVICICIYIYIHRYMHTLPLTHVSNLIKISQESLLATEERGAEGLQMHTNANSYANSYARTPVPAMKLNLDGEANFLLKEVRLRKKLIYIYIYMYICAYIFICICTYICTCICIHITRRKSLEEWVHICTA